MLLDFLVGESIAQVAQRNGMSPALVEASFRATLLKYGFTNSTNPSSSKM